MDDEELYGTDTSWDSDSETPQDLISRLPCEIILQIVEYLLITECSFRGDHNREIKLNQTIMFVFEQKIETEVYQHNPESPILTDFQSFAVVNRQIYSICRPIIWQSLNFSHTISRPMSFWHHEILPKHGAFVKRLDVKLNEEWVDIPNPFSIKRTRDSWKKERYRYQPRLSDLENVLFLESSKRWSRDFWKIAPSFDQLDLQVQLDLLEVEQDIVIIDSSGLCPEDLVTLLSHCDQLTTLHLECPLIRTYEPDKRRNFSSNLASLFPELGHLQHLKITPPVNFLEPVSAECIITPISHLTLLESLDLSNISATSPTQTDSLGACLSALKNLKKLVLKQVEVIGSSWANHEGPPNLVNLMIHECSPLGSSDTPRCISSWAPRLTHLDVRFTGDWDSDSSSPGDSLNFDPKCNRFSLPDLTHLTIWPRSEIQFIHCYSDCKNLSRLLFYLTTREGFGDPPVTSDQDITDDLYDLISQELSNLSKFISTNVFPKLKVVALLSEEWDRPPLEGVLGSKFFPLQEICKSMGIKLLVFPRYEV